MGPDPRRPGRWEWPARRRLLRTIAAAGQVVGLPLASVVVSLVAIRAAGIATWGAFVGAMVLVQLCAQVADFGSRDALVRSFSRDPGAVRPAWRAAFVARLPLLLLGPPVFLAAGNDPTTTLLLCAWMVGLFVGRLHDGMVTFRRAFGFALGVELLAVGAVLVVVAAAGSSLGVTALVGVFTVAAWGRALAVAARFDVLRPGPGWRWSPGELRRSWPFFGLGFSGALQSRVDLYVVAALLPDALLGTYQVLTGFVLLVQSLSAALLGPVVPALYRLGRTGVLLGARRLARLGLGVATAGALGAWFAMTRLYHVEVEPAVIVVAWLAMLPVYAYAPLVHLAFREGDERVVLGANVAGIAVAGGGALLLVPASGIVGAIAAAAAAQGVILAIHVVRTHRRAALARPAASVLEVGS